MVMLAWSASAQAQVFTETFGNAPGRVSNPNVPSNFAFVATGYISDGQYAVMPPQNITGATSTTWWVDLASDHTGDTGGALMVINAGTALSDMYRRDLEVQPGQSYRISAWRYVVNGSGRAMDGPISWSLQMRNTATDTMVVDSGPIPSTARGEWLESSYDFTVPIDCNPVGTGVPGRMALKNQSPVDGGNDFYIDDISVTSIPAAADQPEFCPTGRSTATAVPALDTAGLGLLSLLGAGVGALALRRRRRMDD